jgi:hypothetical protein
MLAPAPKVGRLRHSLGVHDVRPAPTHGAPRLIFIGSFFALGGDFWDQGAFPAYPPGSSISADIAATSAVLVSVMRESAVHWRTDFGFRLDQRRPAARRRGTKQGNSMFDKIEPGRAQFHALTEGAYDDWQLIGGELERFAKKLPDCLSRISICSGATTAGSRSIG